MAQQTSYRAERVNELIRRELVLLLSKETKDPRLQEVVITDVKVSRDLTSAKVFFLLMQVHKKLLQLFLIRPVAFLDQVFLRF